ncbi:hypothetical protein [Nitrobacter sp. TKz-YC02]|uniref:hypothetical protein n=1 Tax=Nitrobacter sp. TKz-YC02 TaxID=3398704 RepID=UPI003CF7B20A
MKISRADALPRSVKKVDFSFEIDSVIVPPFDSSPFHVERVQPQRKTYELDDALFEPCGQTGRVIFVAREVGTLAGYVVVSRGWNGCAVIET